MGARIQGISAILSGLLSSQGRLRLIDSGVFSASLFFTVVPSNQSARLPLLPVNSLKSSIIFRGR